jgi:hypothetical protein
MKLTRKNFSADFAETNWVSADNKKTKIKDLELGHLVNILNWIAIKSNKYPADLIENFTAYAFDIKFSLFSQGKPFPHLADNGKWVVMNPADGTCKVERPPAEYTEKVIERAKNEPGMKRLQTLVSRWK